MYYYAALALNEEWSYATCTPSPPKLWQVGGSFDGQAAAPAPHYMDYTQLYQSAHTAPPNGGTSLGNGNLRASVGRLERNLESWGGRKKGIRAGFQMHSAPATQLSSTLPVGDHYWLLHPGEVIGNWEA